MTQNSITMCVYACMILHLQEREKIFFIDTFVRLRIHTISDHHMCVCVCIILAESILDFVVFFIVFYISSFYDILLLIHN